MNERIEKLAKEHRLIHIHMSTGEYNDALKKFEKLAEIIVQECISQIQELTPLKIPNETHQKLVDATYTAAVNISVAKIKQHFGVEE